MRIASVKRQLNIGINRINIPSSKQILPAAAFIKEYPKNKNISRIYFKKLATAAAALVVVVSVILGVNNINFNGVTPTPQPPVVDTRPVIYATSADNVPSEWNSGSMYESAEGISELLKQKMEEYKDQDVLFSVYVRFPCLREYDNFVSSDEVTKRLEELYKNAEYYEKQIVELQKIYPYGPQIDPNVPVSTITDKEMEELYSHVDDLTEEEIADIIRQIDELDAKTDPFYEEIRKIHSEEEALAREQLFANWQKESETVKNMSGDATIRKFTEHSEIAKNSLTSTYIMELTADIINKIAERGTTSIYLALPERTGEYSKKISDTLTYYLEQMDDDDTIEIAAVSVLDLGNSYALDQNLTRNEFYNEENFKVWPFEETYTYEEFNKAVDNYINEIMVRNNIADKRILHDKLPWLGFEKHSWNNDTFTMIYNEGGAYITSGFNAILTKSEILSLVNEEEIKTLYFVGAIDSSLPSAEHNQ